MDMKVLTIEQISAVFLLRWGRMKRAMEHDDWADMNKFCMDVYAAYGINGYKQFLSIVADYSRALVKEKDDDAE